MLKKYHTRLNITNNIKVCDEINLELKKKEILNNIFEEYYSKPTDEFTNLIKDFCLKDDKELQNYILEAYKKIEIKYNKEDYLDTFMDYFTEVVENTPKEFEHLLLTKIDNMKALINEMSNYFEEGYIEKVKDNFKGLLESSSYQDIIKNIEYNNRLNVPKGTDEVGKTIKSNLFNIAKEIKELSTYNNLEEINY